MRRVKAEHTMVRKTHIGSIFADNLRSRAFLSWRKASGSCAGGERPDSTPFRHPAGEGHQARPAGARRGAAGPDRPPLAQQTFRSRRTTPSSGSMSSGLPSGTSGRRSATGSSRQCRSSGSARASQMDAGHAAGAGSRRASSSGLRTVRLQVTSSGGSTR